MSRKVSVDSVGDASADDILRFLYDLTFRQQTVWGWVAAAAFAIIPLWLAIVCLFEGNVVGGIALIVMAGIIPGIRYFLQHRSWFPMPRKQEIPANDG